MPATESRILKSLEDTDTLAGEMAKKIKGGMTIGLCGELGAGKTTFTKALVKALGSTHEVSSPSYVLAHEYVTNGGLKIEHWDLYRVGHLPDELLEPASEQTVRVIEWADKFKNELGELELVLKLGLGSSATDRVVEIMDWNGGRESCRH